MMKFMHFISMPQLFYVLTDYKINLLTWSLFGAEIHHLRSYEATDESLAEMYICLVWGDFGPQF